MVQPLHSFLAGLDPLLDSRLIESYDICFSTRDQNGLKKIYHYTLKCRAELPKTDQELQRLFQEELREFGLAVRETTEEEVVQALFSLPHSSFLYQDVIEKMDRALADVEDGERLKSGMLSGFRKNVQETEDPEEVKRQEARYTSFVIGLPLSSLMLQEFFKRYREQWELRDSNWGRFKSECLEFLSKEGEVPLEFEASVLHYPRGNVESKAHMCFKYRM